MSIDLSLNTIVQAAVVAGLFWVARTLLSTSEGMKVIKEWADGHEKLDDDRHDAVDKRITRVESRRSR